MNKTNYEGYDDPTAYGAMEAIFKQERTTQNRHRKLVFICSPLAGRMKWNIRNARRYSLYAIGQGVVPVTPHLMYTQYLDDADPEHRAMAMECGISLLRRCSEIWVFGGRVSGGMRREIAFARRHNIAVRYFNGNCEEVPPFA